MAIFNHLLKIFYKCLELVILEASVPINHCLHLYLLLLLLLLLLDKYSPFKCNVDECNMQFG